MRPPSHKNPSHTKNKGLVGGVAQDVGPEFKHQYYKKKKKGERSSTLM
jgi:hypothetical protein